MLQNRFSQTAQDTSVDGTKSEPEDQQSSGLPNDFVLEDKIVWLDGLVGKVRFQLEERMEPFAVTGKDRRSNLQDGEGGVLGCRHSLCFL